MSARALQAAGALLLVAVAIWAGIRIADHHASRLTGVDLKPDFRVGAADGQSPAMPLPKVPDRLPEFSLADRSGKPTSIATWHDKSLIINFWATWCTPCRHEIPLLESLSSDWSRRDVEVVGIAVDHREQVLTYAEEMKIGYPLLIGEQDALDVATALGFESPVFPFTVFTDRRGEVVTLFVGELHRPQADLILSVVQNLNQNRIRLVDARRTIAGGLHALGDSPAS